MSENAVILQKKSYVTAYSKGLFRLLRPVTVGWSKTGFQRWSRRAGWEIPPHHGTLYSKKNVPVLTCVVSASRAPVDAAERRSWRCAATSRKPETERWVCRRSVRTERATAASTCSCGRRSGRVHDVATTATPTWSKSAAAASRRWSASNKSTCHRFTEKYLHPHREGWVKVGGSADPPTLTIWCWGTKLHMAFMILLCCVLTSAFYHLHIGPFPPYTALTISTISRGGVKINVSCYMIKQDFFTLSRCLENGFRAPDPCWSGGGAPPLTLLRYTHKVWFLHVDVGKLYTSQNLGNTLYPKLSVWKPDFPHGRRHYAVIASAISANSFSPVRLSFLSFLPSVLWEVRGAVDFSENLCKFPVSSFKVIIYGMLLRLSDSRRVSCLTAATNTNCQWKLEHRCCLHTVICHITTRLFWGSILHRMLARHCVRGSDCWPCSCGVVDNGTPLLTVVR